MIEVKRKKGESFEALLRRFTQRTQSSGVILELKKRRHHTKKPTKTKLQASALARLASKAKREYLDKIGMLPEEKKKTFGRR
ncbi:MAG: 30S ribosomal protein S21 [Patescibacteria group bacterium]